MLSYPMMNGVLLKSKLRKEMLMWSLRHQRWLRVLIFHWGVPYSLRGEGIILIERLMSLLAAQNFKIWRVECVVWWRALKKGVYYCLLVKKHTHYIRG